MKVFKLAPQFDLLVRIILEYDQLILEGEQIVKLPDRCIGPWYGKVIREGCVFFYITQFCKGTAHAANLQFPVYQNIKGEEAVKLCAIQEKRLIHFTSIL